MSTPNCRACDKTCDRDTYQLLWDPVFMGSSQGMLNMGVASVWSLRRGVWQVEVAWYSLVFPPSDLSFSLGPWG